MKIVLDIDPRNEETSVTIHCKEITPAIQEILEYLKKNETGLIVGKDGENQHIIKPDEVNYFRSEGDTVTAATSEGIFKVKEKLYEIEQSLPSHRFIRISKSVIANLYAMSHFEPSFNGTLCVHFKSGEKEYASRHYVGRIKEILKMNRRELGTVLTNYRETGVLRRYQSTPLQPWKILAAHTFQGTVALLLMVFGMLLYDLTLPAYIGSTLLSLLISILAFFPFALFLTSLAKNAQSAAAISSLFLNLMLFLSGATLPLEMMPSVLQYAAKILPLYYVIQLLRGTWTEALALRRPF